MIACLLSISEKTGRVPCKCTKTTLARHVIRNWYTICYLIFSGILLTLRINSLSITPPFILPSLPIIRLLGCVKEFFAVPLFGVPVTSFLCLFLLFVDEKTEIGFYGLNTQSEFRKAIVL